MDDNPPTRIYVNKIENRIKLRINTEYYLELLGFKTMTLLGSTKNEIIQDKTGKNVHHLESTKVVLIHFNIVNNDYQQDSRVLYTFIPNKSFGQSLDTSHKSVIFLKTFNAEFSYIGVWFTD